MADSGAHRRVRQAIMNGMPGGYWPESPYLKALLILLVISPFALLHWIPWYLAALPAASCLSGWLGRVLLLLDDDQQPGAATSIRMPRRGAEMGSSRRSRDSAGIAPCRTGPNGQN